MNTFLIAENQAKPSWFLQSQWFYNGYVEYLQWLTKVVFYSSFQLIPCFRILTMPVTACLVSNPSLHIFYWSVHIMSVGLPIIRVLEMPACILLCKYYISNALNCLLVLLIYHPKKSLHWLWENTVFEETCQTFTTRLKFWNFNKTKLFIFNPTSITSEREGD